MKFRESVGGGTPQHNRNFLQLNDRSSSCRKCELSQIDRNYSSKSELVVLTSSLFVAEEGGL